VLEIDHVVPRVQGGDDDPANLVTSCFDCNRGKGPRELDENYLAEIREPNFKMVREKLDQLKAYYETLSEKQEFLDAYVDALDHYWWSELAEEEYTWGENRRANLRRMLAESDYYTIRDCMALAFSNKPYWDPNSEKLWKYFCGIVWNRIRRPKEVGQWQGTDV
jgi:hypothetical protein